MNDLYISIAIWSQVISSVVFLAALVYMWSRWILPVVMTAQDRSNRQIAEAERHRDEAKAALQTLREDIEGARHVVDLDHCRSHCGLARTRVIRPHSPCGWK